MFSARTYAGTRNGDGLRETVTDLWHSVSRYGKARLELLQLEGKEAVTRYAVAAGIGVAALGAVILAYIFLCFCIVAAVAVAIGGGKGWIWATGGMAVLHFLIAGIGVWLALQKVKKPMFEHSVDELRKDEEWLHALPRS